jgi:hypothetical protein
VFFNAYKKLPIFLARFRGPRVDAIYFRHTHTHQHYAQAYKLAHQIDVQKVSVVARTNEEGKELIWVPFHLCNRSTRRTQVAERAREARQRRMSREVVAVDDSKERCCAMPDATHHRWRQSLFVCLHHYLRQNQHRGVFVVEVFLPKLQLTEVIAKQSKFMTKMAMRFDAAGMLVEFYLVFLQAEVGEESVEEQFPIVVLVSTIASLTFPGYKRRRAFRMR